MQHKSGVVMSASDVSRLIFEHTTVTPQCEYQTTILPHKDRAAIRNICENYRHLQFFCLSSVCVFAVYVSDPVLFPLQPVALESFYVHTLDTLALVALQPLVADLCQ